MADRASELARLKDLLLRPESSQIEQLQSRVGALDDRLGTRERLESATAEVLVDAFREAEIRQHHELARAVAPVVVAAIQSEIRNSRDMMVEALYPITGRLVAAAVADAFRNLVVSINQRVDTMMSVRLWRLRLKSWMTGKPLSELLLAQASRPRLHRVLLLERGSGSLLASWSDDPAGEDRSDLVSGMIAAITEFSSSVFENRSGELRTIDMGASRILLRSSARAIIAGDFSGPLNPQDEALVHEAFASIAEHHHRGNAVTQDMLRAVADTIADQPEENKKTGGIGIWIVAALLIGIAGYFGWQSWTRSAFESRVRSALAATVAERPHITAYPVTLTIDHAARRVSITGLAPDADDSAAISKAVSSASTPYETQADLAIVASQETTARALTQLRSQVSDLQSRLEANLQSQAASLRETTTAQAQTLVKLGSDIALLQQALQRQDEAAGDLSGRLSELSKTLQTRLEEARNQLGSLQRNIEESRGAIASLQESTRQTPRAAAENFMRRNAIFFERDAVLRDAKVAETTVAQLADLLRAANLRVRVVGYSSDSGSAPINRRLAQERASAVVALLLARGIDAGRIVVATRPAGVSIDDAPDASGHANRRVEFEPVFNNEKAEP
jgi:outer membrane protein OmpA-like peptidoglycan-associated protein